MNCYKRFALVLLALALSFCMVSAALAEGGKLQKRKALTFTAAGTVGDIPSASGGFPFTMTLLIDKAYRIPKGQIGKEVSFTVSGNVKVKTEGTEAGSFDLSFDVIEPDDYVRVLGKKLADDTYLITHIVVHLDE